jgi:hypothetical protein
LLSEVVVEGAEESSVVLGGGAVGLPGDDVVGVAAFDGEPPWVV